MKPIDDAVTIGAQVSQAQARIADRVSPRLDALGFASSRRDGALEYRPKFSWPMGLWALRRLQGEHVTITFDPQGTATEVRAVGKLRDRAHAELTEALRGM